MLIIIGPLLTRRCEKKCEKKNQLISFSYKIRNNRKIEKKNQLHNRNSFQLMSFHYLNVEIIGKIIKIYIFFSNFKNVTSPAYEFLLHKSRSNREIQKCKKKINSKEYTIRVQQK